MIEMATTNNDETLKVDLKLNELDTIIKGLANRIFKKYAMSLI